MSVLTDRLAAYGADISGALERFVDDEELYAQCFQLFLEDSGFAALGSALERKDYAAAFDAAHTLKGVAGNLGLTPLYNAICQVVEPLRHQDYANLDTLYQSVLDARSAVEKLQ